FALDGLERLVPGRRFTLDQRLGQPVGVAVQAAQGRALGADEPLAQRVFGVASYARDRAVVVQGEFQPAQGFAEGTGAERRAVGHRDTPCKWFLFRHGLPPREDAMTQGVMTGRGRAWPEP